MTAAILELARYRRPHLRGRHLVHRGEVCIKLSLKRLRVFYDILCSAREWGGDHCGAGLLVSVGGQGVTLTWDADRHTMSFGEFDAIVAEVEREMPEVSNG